MASDQVSASTAQRGPYMKISNEGANPRHYTASWEERPEYQPNYLAARIDVKKGPRYAYRPPPGYQKRIGQEDVDRMDLPRFGLRFITTSEFGSSRGHTVLEGKCITTRWSPFMKTRKADPRLYGSSASSTAGGHNVRRPASSQNYHRPPQHSEPTHGDGEHTTTTTTLRVPPAQHRRVGGTGDGGGTLSTASGGFDHNQTLVKRANQESVGAASAGPHYSATQWKTGRLSNVIRHVIAAKKDAALSSSSGGVGGGAIHQIVTPRNDNLNPDTGSGSRPQTQAGRVVEGDRLAATTSTTHGITKVPPIPLSPHKELVSVRDVPTLKDDDSPKKSGRQTVGAYDKKNDNDGFPIMLGEEKA